MLVVNVECCKASLVITKWSCNHFLTQTIPHIVLRWITDSGNGLVLHCLETCHAYLNVPSLLGDKTAMDELMQMRLRTGGAEGMLAEKLEVCLLFI